MDFWQPEFTKLLVAVLVGGLIGLERELSDKPAGFRTMILICVGSTLFTIFSVHIAGAEKDPGRVAAQIVTGVGFLGAGAILRDRRQVLGLTTAASIWLVASLGMGVGLGLYRLILPAAFLVLAVLFIFQHVERWIDRRRDDHAYEVAVTTGDEASPERLRRLVQDSGLHLVSLGVSKERDGRRISFRAVGPPAGHRQLTEALLAEPAVLEMARD